MGIVPSPPSHEIDAQDVLNGLCSGSSHYREGNNGDLWARIFSIPRVTDGCTNIDHS